MASDETMTFHSSFQDEHDFDDDVDDASDHHHHHHHQQQHQLQHPHPHNLSRLSVCTSSTNCEDYDDVDNLVSMTSRFSIESFEGDDGDADAELSSDSENEFGNCYSLPSTPPPRRSNNRDERVKECASDNEGRKRNNDPRRRRRRRSRRSVFDFDRSGEKNNKQVSEGFSGESDQSGLGVKVITRPKGGNRSLCMDLEEVKACRDLGFELELPPSLSFSNSTLDTSSGSNSPTANWRISALGDDPRDVKARLKVWAQAVALASAST